MVCATLKRIKPERSRGVVQAWFLDGLDVRSYDKPPGATCRVRVSVPAPPFAVYVLMGSAVAHLYSGVACVKELNKRTAMSNGQALL